MKSVLPITISAGQGRVYGALGRKLGKPKPIVFSERGNRLPGKSRRELGR